MSRLHPAIACLAAACLAAGEAAPPPAPSAGSSTITVNSLRFGREISLTAGTGSAAGATQTQSLTVWLTPKPDPALKLTGEVRVVCDKAVTDAGEDILPPPVVDPMEADMRRMMARRSPRFARQSMLSGTAVKLKHPLKPAKSLMLAGNVVLTCEGKAGETIDLDLAGAAPVLDLPGMRVTAAAGQQAGQFAFSYTTTGAEAKVREFQLIAVDGHVLEAPGQSSSGDGKKMDCTYRLSDAGAKPAKLRVVMLGEQVEVRVPFSYPALPLDAPVVEESAVRPPRMQPMPMPAPAPAPAGKSDF